MRKKKQNQINPKVIFGLSTMSWTTTVAQAFMSSLFMLYITDYAGIKGSISAAAIGTIVLFVGRIVDAVDDPFQGWLMDNAKEREHGKYKFFCMLSILLCTCATVMLFGIPTIVANHTVSTMVWLLCFYLLYDIGSSFYVDGPLKQTISQKESDRTKTVLWPRAVSLFLLIPSAYLIVFLNRMNYEIQNMHDSFLILVLVVMIPMGAISLIGLSMVKEGRPISNNFCRKKISFRDILIMLKTNRPFGIVVLGNLFGGFIWSIVFATAIYYVKWAYCVDMTTGIVDNVTFATYTIVLGSIQMIPMLAATLVSPLFIKKEGSVAKTIQFAYGIMAVAGVVIYLFGRLGLLDHQPMLYFGMLMILFFGNGLTFVPGSLLGMECMDYAAWKTGKVVNGILSTLINFINKFQTAMASIAVGIVLLIIGYDVDSAESAFIGNLAEIPHMLRSFIIVSGLVPAVLAVITVIVYHFYPVTKEERTRMKEDLERRRCQ